MVGLALALVFAKLVKNWQAKCAKFSDTNDPKLNFKIYIKYRNAIFNKKIGTHKKKKIMTLRKIQFIINFFRYLIITLPTNYENNMLFYFFTHEIGFVTIFWRKREQFFLSQHCKTYKDKYSRINITKKKNKKIKKCSFI